MRYMKWVLVGLLLVLVPTVAAQNDVDVPIPDIPPGQELTITYQVTINDELTPNVTTIRNQGTVTGSNFGPVFTDDPVTAADGDPTETQLGFNLAVDELPSTGESPWWRLPLLAFFALGTGIMLFMGWRKLNVVG